jgi:hypothetical protein
VTALSFFSSFPQGVISGVRGGKTVEERLDVVIFVFMKELFKLLRSLVNCTVEFPSQQIDTEEQIILPTLR